MSYVPPHMRKKFVPRSEDTAPPSNNEGLSIRDIQHHYWKGQSEGDTDEHRSTPQHSTLNDSAEHQGKLTHIFLFHGANPRWDGDQIIFVKSNLDILPGYQEAKAGNASGVENSDKKATSGEEASDKTMLQEQKHRHITRDVRLETKATEIPPLEIKPPNPTPIATFSQSLRPRHRQAGFHFTGYYTIDNIALLAPHSRDLTRMLEQKWSLGDGKFAKRNQSAWEESLGHEWAVIKFEKMMEGEVPETPKIEKAPPEERKERAPRKSVNEMLAEMRFGKDADKVKKTEEVS